MAGLAIRYDDNNRREERPQESAGLSRPAIDEDVKIIWKGKKIAKVVFASGKEVVFEE